MEKLNKAWHLSHRMPLNAIFEQRVKWLVQHVKHCACRPVPAKLLEQMKAERLKLPERRINGSG
jgi:hypothetical protein